MKTWLLILCSACLTALAFLFEKLFFVAYISLVPLFWLFFEDSRQMHFRKGFVFGALCYGIASYWLLHLHPLDFLDISHKVSLAAVLTAWLAISAIHGLLYGAFFVLCRRLTLGDWRDCLTYAFLWIALERIQSIGLLAFPFFSLAVTQVSVLPMIQSASLFGSLCISWLLVFCNAGIAYWRKEKKILGITLLIFLLNLCYGTIVLCLPAGTENSLKVALIQGNISSNQKWEDNTTADIFRIYHALTEQAIAEEQPDMVIWPETTLPVALNDTLYLEKLQQTAICYQTPLIVGGFYYDEQSKKDYNCVYYIQTDGTVDWPLYAKRQLVPFGEFLPLRNTLGQLFPILQSINASGSDLTAGTASTVNQIPSAGTFGSLVCFDSIFPHIARESVKNGAQAMVLTTNDSWFEDSPGVCLHNAHAVLRAVENGRWIARAANTGISCFVSPRGEMEQPLSPLTKGYTVHEIATQDSNTPYTLTGNLLLLVGLGYLLYIGKEKQWKIF